MSEETEAQPIRVAIVDDQELIRMGLRMVLDVQPDIEVVAEAADGREATALDPAGLDVVLMDVRMPRLDGIAATGQIVSALDAPRVLVLTTFDLDEYAFSAIRAGASGFLLKDARPDELLGAIRAVHSGDAVLAPSVTRKLMQHFAGAPLARSAAPYPTVRSGEPMPRRGYSAENAPHPPAAPAPQRNDRASANGPAAPVPAAARAAAALASLTPREREILVAIAEGLSNDELAERFFLSLSTVKTHVGRLLQKLGSRDRVHLVILAYESGLAS